MNVLNKIKTKENSAGSENMYIQSQSVNNHSMKWNFTMLNFWHRTRTIFITQIALTCINALRFLELKINIVEYRSKVT